MVFEIKHIESDQVHVITEELQNKENVTAVVYYQIYITDIST